MRVWIDQGGAYGNLGDEAMLLVAVQRLRRLIPGARFVVGAPAHQPLPAIGEHERVEAPFQLIAAIDRMMERDSRRLSRLIRNTPWYLSRIQRLADQPDRLPGHLWQLRERLIDTIDSCDALYSVGAANLNDWTAIDCILPRLWIARQFAQRAKPVVVSSQTVGPCQRNAPARLIGDYARLANPFTLRDRDASLQCLHRCGVRLDPQCAIGDEAFTLAPDSAGARAYLDSHEITADEPFTLMHLRQTDYRRRLAPDDRRVSALLRAAAARGRVLLCPMSYGRHSGDDAAWLARAADAAGVTGRAVPGRSITDARLARGLVRHAAQIIALSYHLQVFALAEHRPFLCLVSGEYYRHKAQALLGWLAEDRRHLLELDHADQADAIIDRMLGDRDALTAHLREVSLEIRYRQQRHEADLLAALRGGDQSGRTWRIAA